MHWIGPGGQTEFFAAHYSTAGPLYTGWLGLSLQEIVQEIGAAVQAIGDKDVLVIELSHGARLMDVERVGSVEPFYGALIQPDLDYIANAFTQGLDPFLYKVSPAPTSPTVNFWDLTPADFVAAGKKVFVITGGDTASNTLGGPIFLKGSSPGDPAAGYYNSWTDAASSDPLTLIGEITTSLQGNLDEPQPYLLAYHCTGQPAGSSLQSLAGQLNPLFMDSLANWCSTGAIEAVDNRVPVIVAADYVASDDLSLLDACVGMSFGQWYGLPGGTPTSQRCAQGPAIAWLNGIFYVAWSGTNSALNAMSSPDGTTWGDQMPPSSQRSTLSPALCACGDLIHISWTGTDSKGQLNFSTLDTSGTTISGIPGSQYTGQATGCSPALACLNGVLYAAWTGTNGHLNVMWSADNGKTFPGTYTSPSQRSIASPALCVLGDTLWIIWTGTDNQLNVAPLQVDQAAITGFGPQSQPGQASQYGPAAAAVGAALYIGWAGYGNGRLNLITTTDGQVFTGQYSSVQATSATPALCSTGTDLYYAWAGTDQNSSLNIRQFILPGQISDPFDQEA